MSSRFGTRGIRAAGVPCRIRDRARLRCHQTLGRCCTAVDRLKAPQLLVQPPCRSGGLTAPRTASTTRPGWCTAPTPAASTRPSGSPNDWSRPASTSRLARSGDAYDNALAESQIGLDETQLINPDGPWRNREHVEIETLNWVYWFNNDRPHESVDDLTPVQVEPTSLHSPNRPRRGQLHTKPSLRTRRGGSLAGIDQFACVGIPSTCPRASVLPVRASFALRMRRHCLPSP
jgi:transposase InsO family protein